MPRASSKVVTMVSTAKPRNLKTAKKVPTKAKRQTRNRRSPEQLIADLKTKLDTMTETFESRKTLLTERISGLEARYGARFAVAEMVANKTPEQIETEEAELKAQLSLLRKARNILNK